MDKGSQFKITCTAEGYRAPHEVSLVKDGTSLEIWTDLSAQCTMVEFYKYSCVYNIASSGKSSIKLQKSHIQNTDLFYFKLSSSCREAVHFIVNSLTILVLRNFYLFR